VRQELRKLDEAVAELGQFPPVPDRRNLYACAFLLQSFYTGLENALKRALKLVGAPLPSGDNWHYDLLQSAAKEEPNSHPAIISELTKARLNELRGFRHVAQTHYGMELDAEKIVPLLDGLPSVWEMVRTEIQAFLEFAQRPK
jgi:hypothetical protein